MSEDTTLTVKKLRAVRLRSLDDVRRFLAKIINEVRSGELDPQTASKLGYLANILAGTIKDGKVEELEERLDAWERENG